MKMLFFLTFPLESGKNSFFLFTFCLRDQLEKKFRSIAKVLTARKTPAKWSSREKISMIWKFFFLQLRSHQHCLEDWLHTSLKLSTLNGERLNFPILFSITSVCWLVECFRKRNAERKRSFWHHHKHLNCGCDRKQQDVGACLQKHSTNIFDRFSCFNYQ